MVRYEPAGHPVFNESEGHSHRAREYVPESPKCRRYEFLGRVPVFCQQSILVPRFVCGESPDLLFRQYSSLAENDDVCVYGQRVLCPAFPRPERASGFGPFGYVCVLRLHDVLLPEYCLARCDVPFSAAAHRSGKTGGKRKATLLHSRFRGHFNG